jgi:hypothetical protein
VERQEVLAAAQQRAVVSAFELLEHLPGVRRPRRNLVDPSRQRGAAAGIERTHRHPAELAELLDEPAALARGERERCTHHTREDLTVLMVATR